MKCIRFRKYLMPYAEGALSEKTRKAVEEHLAVCESCAREMDELRQTVDALKRAAYPAMEPASDLRSRVMGRIAREPARRSWWTGRLPAYSAAAAALLIFAIVIFTVEPMFIQSRESSRSAMKSAPQQTAGGPAEPLSPLPKTTEPRAAQPRMGDKFAANDAKTTADGVSVPPAEKSKDFGFHGGYATPPAAPEGHPRNVAQSPYGGAQKGPAGPAGPAETLESARGAGNIAPAREDACLVVEEKEQENVLALEGKLKEFPNSRTVLLELLDAYRETGQADDEYAIAKRLTKLEPDNPRYWFARAQAAERANKPRTAIACYRQAIELKLAGPELKLAKARLEALESDESR